MACDVRDPEAVEAMVGGIVGPVGPPRRGRQQRGRRTRGRLGHRLRRFNERIIALNLLAPCTGAQAANRVMQDQAAGGAIVNIASVSGTRPSPDTAAYGAAKAGLLNLTQTLAMEWAPRVRVNAVIAGLIATEDAHLHYGDERAVARVAATVPAGRMGSPDEVAAACLFLSSPLAPFRHRGRAHRARRQRSAPRSWVRSPVSDPNVRGRRGRCPAAPTSLPLGRRPASSVDDPAAPARRSPAALLGVLLALLVVAGALAGCGGDDGGSGGAGADLSGTGDAIGQRRRQR